MPIFGRSVTCRFFFRNCTHILTRTQGKKFEDMFLVKIANKETSLNKSHMCMNAMHEHSLPEPFWKRVVLCYWVKSHYPERASAY